MSDTRKSIFITGAASGIGLATAVLFAERGWYVGATDINEERLRSLSDKLGADNCFAHVLDVSDKAAYEQVLEKFGRPTKWPKSSGKPILLINFTGMFPRN
jgi:NADP-dependent 3-hydroxy acid dehydrogenase YdfG